jgi:hypothetical protein
MCFMTAEFRVRVMDLIDNIASVILRACIHSYIH